jgi:serine phosphatase RsbU (regulator of sigma subunit)/anti-sigma regulatory factor (Ser/Thr protein kinase)/anti-anti-sigma regulatory factor
VRDRSADEREPWWAELAGRVGDPITVTEAFDQLPLIAVAYEGVDLRIAAYTAATRAAWGTEALGRPLVEVLPGVVGQELAEGARRTVVTGEPFVGREWRMTFDPADPAKEAFIDFVIVPWRYPDGRTRGCIGYALDVTDVVRERRAAEARAAGAETRLQEVRDVVLTLQRSLLPEVVPVLPAARMAARYVVAGAELQAGGDWFDAVPVGGGRVALVVGDIVGHGAAAAAAMARLRTVLYEALLSGAPTSGAELVDAVHRLDAFAAHEPATRAATVCVVLVDPDAGTLVWVSRGHPLPLVVSADGSARYLPGSPGRPLGLGAGPSTPDSRTLLPDETVLLYSDGLVERAGETLADGQARLARIAASAVGTRGRTVPGPVADRLCELVVERVVRDGCTDDVTVLAAHRLPAPTPALHLDVQADVDGVVAARDRLSAWLDDLGVGSRDRLAALLVATEATTNVVDHAYREGSPGRFRLAAELDDRGRLRLVVADDGRWRRSGSGNGGRGLVLMRSLCDEVTVDRGAGGTTVLTRRALGHPTVVGTEGGPVEPAARPSPRFDAVVTRRDPTVVTVRGVVDAATVGLLRSEVLRHGADPVVLDLSPVDLLASAGVQLLHELSADGRVQLAATPESPARLVLDLTGLGTLLVGSVDPT